MKARAWAGTNAPVSTSTTEARAASGSWPATLMCTWGRSGKRAKSPGDQAYLLGGTYPATIGALSGIADGSAESYITRQVAGSVIACSFACRVHGQPSP